MFIKKLNNMSATKEFYQNEINRNANPADDMDLNYQYEEYLEEQHIKEMAERDQFNRIFEATHTYPI